MIIVERFINELMQSNCYIVYDNDNNHCFIIDPGSEKSQKEIDFICSNKLKLDFIILTHEHTDHTWGVNALIKKFDAKVICSSKCAINLDMESQSYFRYYMDDTEYEYHVNRIDILVGAEDAEISWQNHILQFIPTPGHSMGSMCVYISHMLFTGDAWMQFKPFINKRNGSKKEYFKSLKFLQDTFSNKEITIYPGHGEKFLG